MKTVLWITTLVFFLLSWWWYVCPHKQVCPFGSHASIGNASVKVDEAPSDDSTSMTGKGPASSMPLAFKWSRDVPVISSSFDTYRDSVLTQLGATDQLEIVGKYYSSEENPTRFENLGLARAHQIKDLLPGIDSSRLVLRSQLIKDTVLDDQSFVAYSLRKMIYNESVREMEGRMVINFPHASDEMLDNLALNHYLDKLVIELQNTHEKVYLEGHTDSSASQARNQRLGQMRADAIRQLLVRKGLPSGRIIVVSKGESEPIADNRTAQGRRQNRRVELTIIQ